VSRIAILAGIFNTMLRAAARIFFAPCCDLSVNTAIGMQPRAARSKTNAEAT
jgi:hypothetical protein